MPEVRGYETTTKLLAARDSATASRDTTGTLMDLLHQATDLSNNALSGQKASDIVTKLLDLLPAFNRAIPIIIPDFRKTRQVYRKQLSCKPIATKVQS